jgi:hypothetical protein
MGRKRKLKNVCSSGAIKMVKLSELWGAGGGKCVSEIRDIETVNDVDSTRAAEIVESAKEIPQTPPKVSSKPRLVSTPTRSFRESWKHGRPWLEYDNVAKIMSCSTCKRAQVKNSFTTGCSVMKVENVTKHQNGKGKQY